MYETTSYKGFVIYKIDGLYTFDFFGEEAICNTLWECRDIIDQYNVTCPKGWEAE